MVYYMKSKIVTAILIFMIVCLSIIPFASCSSKNYEVTYLTDTNVIVETNDITLITSENELNTYKNTPRFTKAGNNVMEKMEMYSSDFFDAKMLIVINLQEISRSIKITVEKIDFTNSEANITLKRKTPDVFDDAIKIWSIFIEFDIREIESVDLTIV